MPYAHVPDLFCFEIPLCKTLPDLSPIEFPPPECLAWMFVDFVLARKSAAQAQPVDMHEVVDTRNSKKTAEKGIVTVFGIDECFLSLNRQVFPSGCAKGQEVRSVFQIPRGKEEGMLLQPNQPTLSFSTSEG